MALALGRLPDSVELPPEPSNELTVPGPAPRDELPVPVEEAVLLRRLSRRSDR